MLVDQHTHTHTYTAIKLDDSSVEAKKYRLEALSQLSATNSAAATASAAATGSVRADVSQLREQIEDLQGQLARLRGETVAIEALNAQELENLESQLDAARARVSDRRRKRAAEERSTCCVCTVESSKVAIVPCGHRYVVGNIKLVV